MSDLFFRKQGIGAEGISFKIFFAERNRRDLMVAVGGVIIDSQVGVAA